MQVLIIRMNGLGLKMGTFRQKRIGLCPLIYVRISFLLSILSIFLTIFYKLSIRVKVRKEWYGIVHVDR